MADSALEEMLLPTRLVFNSRHVEQNDFLRKIISIKNYPASFETICILQRIATTKGITLKIILKPLSQMQVTKLVNIQLNNKKATLQNRGQSSNKIKAEVEEKNLKSAFTEFLNNNERFYFVTVLIEVYAPDKDELNKRVSNVKSQLAAYGITEDGLIYEQQQAYLSMMPTGSNHMMHMARNMPSSTVSALFPCSSSDRRDREGMYLGSTTDGGNIYLDIWQRDDKNTNGNVVIIGETGQGKSTLLKILISMQIACGTSVFVLDPEREYSEMITKLGGTSIDCATGRFKINPLEIRRIVTKEDVDENDNDDAPAAFKDVSAFKQHLSWLRDFYKVLKPYATEAEINILLILTQDLYHKFHIDEDTDVSLLSSKDYPTIGNLYEYIMDVYANFNKYKNKYCMFRRDALQNILLFLKDDYDGSESTLFNGQTNVSNSDVIDFDLNTLLQGSRSRSDAMLFNIMTWIWNKVTNRNMRRMFAIDELYLIMNRENLIMAEYLRNFAKRARKYEAIISMATQNLADFQDPAIKHISTILFNNPNYKFIFYPGEMDMHEVKKMLSLTDGEKDLISEPARGYCLLKAGGDAYHMHVDMLPYAAKLFGKGGGR